MSYIMPLTAVQQSLWNVSKLSVPYIVEKLSAGDEDTPIEIIELYA